MESGDRRGLEVAAGLDGARSAKRVSGGGGFIESLAEALLHLAGGLLGEGHRGDPGEVYAVDERELEDAVHESRRGVAVRLVGERAHRISSRAKSGLPGSRPRSAARLRS